MHLKFKYECPISIPNCVTLVSLRLLRPSPVLIPLTSFSSMPLVSNLTSLPPTATTTFVQHLWSLFRQQSDRSIEAALDGFIRPLDRFVLCFFPFQSFCGLCSFGTLWISFVFIFNGLGYPFLRVSTSSSFPVCAMLI